MVARRLAACCTFVVALACAGTPVAARAQGTTARPAAPPPRSPVPTPQLVTVRPREPLRFGPQLMVPTFYDRNFWPSILGGYDIALPSPVADTSGSGATARGAAPPTASAAPAAPRPAPRRARRPAPR